MYDCNNVALLQVRQWYDIVVYTASIEVGFGDRGGSNLGLINQYCYKLYDELTLNIKLPRYKNVLYSMDCTYYSNFI